MESLKVKKYAGFTVIEIIVAISVLLFGIVIVYGAFSSVTVSTYNASSRFVAAYLAQEGLEIVRNLRDKNFITNSYWSAGLSSSPCNIGCQADYKTVSTGQLTAYNDAPLKLDSNGFYSYDLSANGTMYKRKITISPVQGTTDAIYVSVVVYWTYNGKSLNFEANEYLYNWY